MSDVKRPRLRQIDLMTINTALDHYIGSLQDQLASHEEDEARFERPDEWLQKREELNWLLTNARHAKVKAVANLEGAQGRTPEPLKQLLNVKADEKPGQYIRLLDAMKLLPFNDFCTAMNVLCNAVDEGVLNAFRDPSDHGLLKIRKVDVLRYVAYLEAHR